MDAASLSFGTRPVPNEAHTAKFGAPLLSDESQPTRFNAHLASDETCTAKFGAKTMSVGAHTLHDDHYAYVDRKFSRTATEFQLYTTGYSTDFFHKKIPD